MDGNLTSPDPTDAQHSSHGRALQSRHTIVADSPTSVVEQWETQLFTLSLGLLLLVLAPVLLVGAEVAAARFAKLLKQARSLTCADAPSDRPRKRFNAHVVHTQGVMTVGPSWSDADTGVSWGASLADKLDTVPVGLPVGLLEQAGVAPPGQPTPFYPPRFTPSAAPRRPSIDRRLSEPGAATDAASADESFTRLAKSDGMGERSSVGPLRIKRSVDVFVWKEQEREVEKEEGGRTRTYKVYEYEREWVSVYEASDIPNSNRFKHAAGHHNPFLKVHVLSTTFDRDDVSLGGYALSTEALHRADWWQDHAIPPSTVLGGKLRYASARGEVTTDGAIYVTSGGAPSGAAPSSSVRTLSRSATIGDMRIRYETVPCPQGVCTAVGLQQDGEAIGRTPRLRPATKADVYECAGIDPHTGGAAHGPYDANGRRRGPSFADIVDVIVMIMGEVVGDDVFILRRGAWRPRAMFWVEEARMDRMMLLLRLAGTVLFVLAFVCILSPLSWLVRWIPLVGRLIATVFFLAAVVAGVASAAFTIACAWVYNKPVHGAILFTVLALGAAAATLSDHAQSCMRCEGDDPAAWPPLWATRMIDVAPTVPMAEWLPLLPLLLGALLATAAALDEAMRAHAFQEAVRTEMATVARQATAKRLLRGSIAPDGRSTRSLL